jgi:REP element-mobilizing transposase RayT
MKPNAKTRCWIHLIWGTEPGKKHFANYDLRKAVSKYFSEYAASNNIEMDCNYVNADHIHMLLDLPEKLSQNEIAEMFKKSSSDWIGISSLLSEHFNWEDGFSAFSVSQSNVEAVRKYILSQDELHRTESYEEELQHFFEGYGII